MPAPRKNAVSRAFAFLAARDPSSQYLAENWKPLEEPIANKDFAAFEAAFHASIDAANAYHELKEKPYIYWKLPDAPPPDLDLREGRGKIRRTADVRGDRREEVVDGRDPDRPEHLRAVRVRRRKELHRAFSSCFTYSP